MNFRPFRSFGKTLESANTKFVVYAGLLVVVLIVGAFLRLDNIVERGLVEWDEGQYLVETQFIRSAIGLVSNLENYQGVGGAARFEADVQGRPPVSAKPGHDLAIYVVSLFFGLRDYTGPLTSAIFGICTIIATFFIGGRLFSWGAGTGAATVIAVSGLHVMYSRAGLAEVVSPFFLLLGVAGLVSLGSGGRVRYWLAIVTGLALGYGVTCNYRWIPIVIALMLGSALWTALFADRNSRRAQFGGIGIATAAGLVPPVIMQVPYWVGQIMGLPLDSKHGPTYFDHVWWFFKYKPAEGKFLAHDLFVSQFWALEGPLITALAIAAIGLVLWRIRDWRIVAFSVPVVIPLLLFSLSVRGDRLVAISIVAPFSAILAGLVIDWAVRKFPSRVRSPILAGLIAAILAVGVWNTSWLLDVRSDWRGVMRYIENAGSPKLLGYQPAIAKYYLGLKNARNVPKDDAEMADAISDGFRFLVLDWKKYHDDYENDVVRKIDKICDPLAIFENNVVYFPIFVDDFHYAHPGSKMMHEPDVFETRILSDPHADKIRLYDISGYLSGEC
jgi:hypothetical protein